MPYLFSWTDPPSAGRQTGAMLLSKTTSVDKVMMAKSFTSVLLPKLGCFTKELGVKLFSDRKIFELQTIFFEKY